MEQFITSTSRGKAKEVIFLLEKDFADFLGVLGLVVKRYHFLLPAYCLMKNHYHLLMETPEGNLSRGMRQLNGLYTKTIQSKTRESWASLTFADTERFWWIKITICLPLVGRWS
jgi:REP element-mobilizing transposase RayT